MAAIDRSGILYVFLHGLHVISQRINEMEIVLPNVPGHVQQAGTWLAETDIGTSIAFTSGLRLHGVKDGGMRFSANNFIIDLSRQTSLTNNGRAATLILPYPKGIVSLLHAVDSNYVVRVGGGGPPLQDVATVHVLVYDYDDENEVFLDGHFWEPCPTGRAISLHIISTSLEPETKEHDLATEAALSVVLDRYPGLDFKSDPRPLVAPWIDPTHPDYHPGSYQSVLKPYDQNGDYFLDTNGNYAFAKAELEQPTLRFARLKRLGRLIQRKEPIEGLWTDPEPIGDRVANCATILTN
jgi:hypothetical protein